MRILISFFLSLIIYFAIVFMFFKFLLPKPSSQKEVLIHTAIVESKPAIKKIKKSTTENKVKKIKKVTKVKKSGSKTNISKGGDVDLKDIFKNVKENIDTTPLKLQKFEDMSRFKGLEVVKKNLSKLKTFNEITLENKSSKKITKKDINEIINKISKIWDEISDIPGEYAKINVINKNGTVYVRILNSNLSFQKQQELIQKIKNLRFNEDFNVNILFLTKVNK